MGDTGWALKSKIVGFSFKINYIKSSVFSRRLQLNCRLHTKAAKYILSALGTYFECECSYASVTIGYHGKVPFSKESPTESALNQNEKNSVKLRAVARNLFKLILILRHYQQTQLSKFDLRITFLENK